MEGVHIIGIVGKRNSGRSKIAGDIVANDRVIEIYDECVPRKEKIAYGRHQGVLVIWIGQRWPPKDALLANNTDQIYYDKGLPEKETTEIRKVFPHTIEIVNGHKTKFYRCSQIK